MTSSYCQQRQVASADELQAERAARFLTPSWTRQIQARPNQLWTVLGAYTTLCTRDCNDDECPHSQPSQAPMVSQFRRVINTVVL